MVRAAHISNLTLWMYTLSEALNLKKNSYLKLHSRIDLAVTEFFDRAGAYAYHCAPRDRLQSSCRSKSMLPKQVDPRRLAEQKSQFDELVQVHELSRLVNAVHRADSAVEVHLVFTVDPQYRTRLQGRVKTQVQLLCQRCVDVFDLELDQELDLIVVRDSEHARRIPKDKDAWEAGQSANLYELIEDELLLALPVVASHPMGECQAPKFPGYEETPEPLVGRQRPFEILKKLRAD